jgi:hypothetical protein
MASHPGCNGTQHPLRRSCHAPRGWPQTHRHVLQQHGRVLRRLLLQQAAEEHVHILQSMAARLPVCVRLVHWQGRGGLRTGDHHSGAARSRGGIHAPYADQQAQADRQVTTGNTEAEADSWCILCTCPVFCEVPSVAQMVLHNPLQPAHMCSAFCGGVQPSRAADCTVAAILLAP